jgi:MoaA/NifB/PqqE/SkfB family radical SAM enzyme
LHFSIEIVSYINWPGEGGAIMFFDRFWRRTSDRAALVELVESFEAPHEQFHVAIDRARKRFLKDWKTLDEALLGVKLINLAVARHEYRRRSVATIARPVGFMLDPANQCQLGCPSCTNTVNTDHSERTFNQWPRGLMPPERYQRFIDAVGLSSFCGHFYNNHEPFLNRETPSYIRAAVDLRIQTFVSSNLSYAKLDVEAIVRSGLHELMVAIDGTTQDVYEKYRKRGRLDWVLANARAIADAKRKLNSPTPYLRWQFLTFEHNVHQVPDAIALARETGFDTFNLATPFRVSADDPNVHSIAYQGPDEHRAVVYNDRLPAPFTGSLDRYEDLILGRLRENVGHRWKKVKSLDVGIDQAAPEDRCDWLHLAVISDAMGRVVPCCLGDYKGLGTFIFSNIDADSHNLMNSPAYREARLLLANPTAYRETMKAVPPTQRVRCNKCPIRPLPQIGLGAIGAYFAFGNNLPAAVLSDGQKQQLSDWSQHTHERPKVTA